MAAFQIDISYRQLAVFLRDIKRPFNDWAEVHVAQGFAWRNGSVSFRTLEDGPIDVNVVRGETAQPRGPIVRVIRVPFEIPDGKSIDVASISDSQAIELPAGGYALTFEHGQSQDGAMWCNLLFSSRENPVDAAVLVADDELSPPSQLLMEATPA